MKFNCSYTDLIETHKLVPNPRNANIHSNKQIEMLAKIIDFQGQRSPIIVSKESGFIVKGHARLMAIKLLGWEQVAVDYQSYESPAQEYADLIADNKIAELAKHDDNKMKFDLKELNWDLDIELLGFENLDIEFKNEEDYDKKYEYPDSETNSLVKRFIVPPFSYLDTKQKYWMDRKSFWDSKIGNTSESREDTLGTALIGSINEGTSNFDPVLAEVLYHWFNIPNGKILDPFGGEQTKGFVAGYKGYEYKAVEFRKEQVDINKKRVEQFKNVDYFYGDSSNISEIIKERKFDFCFTSPPYYDLEVYSKEDMSALGSYDEFMIKYKDIFKQCVDMLEDNRFLAIKISEIRDKKGVYRNFLGDNISLFKELGLKYYNEFCLLNKIGTAPVRATRFMVNRKPVKIHQNVLVFFKGDLNEIRYIYPDLSKGTDEK